MTSVETMSAPLSSFHRTTLRSCDVGSSSSTPLRGMPRLRPMLWPENSMHLAEEALTEYRSGKAPEI